jgi:hypothetical protein
VPGVGEGEGSEGYTLQHMEVQGQKQEQREQSGGGKGRKPTKRCSANPIHTLSATHTWVATTAGAARWHMHKTNLGTVCPHALELGQGVSATPGDAWRAAVTMTVPAQPTTHS